MTNSTVLEKIFPIQHIQDNNYLVNGNGDITIAVKVKHQQVFSHNQSDMEKDLVSYTNMLKLLPPNTIFHKQDFYSTGQFYVDYEYDDLVTIRDNKVYYNKKPIVKHESYIYLTFITQNKKKSNPLFSLSNYILNKPFELLESVTHELDRKVKSFINNLQAIESIQEVILLDKEELQCLLYKYTALDKSINSVIGSVPGIRVDKGLLNVGKNKVNIISLLEEGALVYYSKPATQTDPKLFENNNDYPTKVSLLASMMYPVTIGLPIDHIVNTVIHVIDNDLIVREINSKNSFLNVLASTVGGASKGKKQAINNFNTALTEHGEKGCKFAQNIVVFNEDVHLLNKWVDLIQSTYKNINGCTSFLENQDTLELFWANIPGNSNYNIRYKYSIIDVAACYLPRESFHGGSDEGFMCVDTFGNPIKENLLFTKSTTNKNMVVFGPSGSGKTNFLCWFTDNNLNNNHDVIIINVKPDYINHCKIHHGAYVNTDDNKYKSINPFYTYKENGNWFLPSSKATLIRVIIGHIWKSNKGITNDENAILNELISSYYDYVNKENIAVPVFNNFYEYIDKFETNLEKDLKDFLNFNSLRLALKPFYSGVNKTVLNAERNVDLMGERYIVFDLMSVLKDPVLFDLYLYYIIDFSTDKIIQNSKKNKFTNIIMDECIDSMQGGGGTFVGEQYRKIRSMNGGIAICTQGISYLDGVDPLVKESIKTNSDIKILLDHSTITGVYGKIQEYLSLDDYEIRILDSITKGNHYREWLLKKGTDKAIKLRNENSVFTNAVYSTSPNDVNSIKTKNSILKERGVNNLSVAIKNYINDETK